jgi:hypothetical protein
MCQLGVSAKIWIWPTFGDLGCLPLTQIVFHQEKTSLLSPSWMLFYKVALDQPFLEGRHMERFQEQLDRVRSRLDALRSADSAFQVFGAASHHYHLGTPMTEAEMQAFEDRHTIVLPEEYRTFLQTMGREGAGPYYGLFPPTDFLHQLKHAQSDFLSLPFPHQEAWNWTADAILADEHAYFDPSWVQGSMRICHSGCGAFCLLVVTGQARGQIWLDYRSSDGGIFPVANTFLQWYEQWLERSFRDLEKLQKPPLVFRRRIFDKHGKLLS